MQSVFTQSRGTEMTKAMAAMLVSLTKEVNQNSFVRGHQYGGYDVTFKHSIGGFHVTSRRPCCCTPTKE